MKDIIIIGGGPSGLTAALYAARAELDAVMLEKSFQGGQMVTTNEVENYPGIIEITGPELANTMYEQAVKFGAQIKFEEVLDIEDGGDVKKVITSSGIQEAKVVILSMGAKPKKLGVPDEEALAGKGVSYCAICDGGFYKDQTVAVVGGGDTAIEDALYLSRLAKKVYLIHRRNELRGNKNLQKRLFNSNVEILWDSAVTKLYKGTQLEGIQVSNLVEGTTRDVELNGLFVAVGSMPETGLVKDLVALDERGYIITDENCATNREGIFAIGDIRKKNLRQIVTAAADGAISIYEAEKYILDKEAKAL